MTRMDWSKLAWKGKHLKGTGIPRHALCRGCRRKIVLRWRGEWTQYEPDGRTLHRCPSEFLRAHRKANASASAKAACKHVSGHCLRHRHGL
jgi:hypothetical protein